VTRPTIVLGLGNVLMSDEGLGIHALRRLLASGRLDPEAQAIDGGTMGLELLSLAAGARRLLVIDAIDLDAAPGELLRVDGEALAAMQGEGSAHSLGLGDLLLAMRMLGEQPEDVVVLGLQPDRVSLGTATSEAVEQALPMLVEAALEQLDRWQAIDRRAEVRHA